MSSLPEWLKSIGLERFAGLMADNEIDLETLRILSERDLEQLGVPFGPRKRLLNELAELEPPSVRAADTDADRARSTAPDELRQLTVLFCDLVSFTPLAGRLEPEALQSVLRAYEDCCAVCITRYQGYVFQRLGDGVVAFFGFPLAHEGEAERAMRAGLGIVESMQELELPGAGRLQVRIGIASGVVLVSADGKSVAGQTVNLAARLQSIAAPGSVVVSEGVKHLAGPRFEYEDLGPKTLKGLEHSVHAFRVTALSSAASRFEAAAQVGLTSIVGREEELALLLERWKRAQIGAGQVVLVSGEAGIGKSRVVSELRKWLSPSTDMLLHFQCSPFNVNSAFQPMADSFEHAVGLHSGESTASSLAKLEAYAVDRFGLPIEDVRYLAGILSIPCADRYGPAQVAPRQHKRKTVLALVGLIKSIARCAPTIMLFEDLHWADPTSREVLDLLIQESCDVPLLVLLTARRPEFRSQWAYDHFTELHLTKLTGQQSRDLIAHSAGGNALPESLIVDIVAKTDGVPLFVEELTTSLIASGALRLEGKRYVFVGSPAELAIPPTLRDSLMARLDQVASGKEIAQIGSVLGREFSHALIAAVADAEGVECENALARLTQSGLASRRGTLPDAIYVFKHALVQDVAYESLLKSRRRALHGTIAQVFERNFPAACSSKPELLAHHYTAAERVEAAIPYWRRAGELALSHFATAEASAHLKAGIDLTQCLPSGTERAHLELELRTLAAPAVVAVNGWAAPEVRELLEPAWAAAESLARESGYIPILHGLWVHFMSAGQHVEAMDWARTMLAVAERTGNEEIAICGHRSAMTSHFWMGHLLQSREHGDYIRAGYDPERHRHIADLTNNDPLTADGSYRAQYLWMLGFPEQALALSDEKDDHARRRNHPFDLCFALTVGAQAYDYCRAPEALLARVEEAERVGRENHLPLMSDVMAQLVKGAAWLRAGHAREAAELLQSSLEQLEQTGHRAWIPYVRANLGEALARSGDMEGGLACIEASLVQARQQQEESHLAEIMRLEGWILMQRDCLPEAERALRDARDCARRQHARSWELRIAMTLAQLLVRRGERETARTQLASVYDEFTEGFDTPDLQEARALLQELS